VAASLAVTLANLEKGRVLLVRTKPNGSSADTNLAHVNNLVVMSRKEGVRIGRLFDTKYFANLLRVWRRAFSFVVFDTPAVLEESSAARLAGLADGVLMVLEAERERWEVAQKAKDQLVQASARLLGVVLNRRRYPIPEWLYKTL
jgi:Mrp family chromosome partitioning ATPase